MENTENGVSFVVDLKLLLGGVGEAYPQTSLAVRAIDDRKLWCRLCQNGLATAGSQDCSGAKLLSCSHIIAVFVLLRNKLPYS